MSFVIFCHRQKKRGSPLKAEDYVTQIILSVVEAARSKDLSTIDKSSHDTRKEILLKQGRQKISEVQTMRHTGVTLSTIDKDTHNTRKEAVDYAHSIETQAEIKLGEILLLMDKNEGAKGIGKSVIRNDDSTLPPTLTELGISLNLSSEAQALASLPGDGIR